LAGLECGMCTKTDHLLTDKFNSIYFMIFAYRNMGDLHQKEKG